MTTTLMAKSRLDLSPLLTPRSIAVIGATEASRMTNNLIRHLQATNYRGQIYPVNPKYQQVLGFPCFPDIASVPEQVDCAYIVVPARIVSNVLQECGAAGTRSVVAIASGFAEKPTDDGKTLQSTIATTARNAGVLMCGPNCTGTIDLHHSVWALTAAFGGSPLDLPRGSFGLVSQSGGLLLSTMELGYNRGLGFSYLISSGNEAVITSSDYIDCLLDDSNTAVVGAIIEGFRDPAHFLRVADRAIELGKPLIVLKGGRTEKGERAIRSHTASLAGSHDVHRAMFRQKGITLVDCIDELVETAILFSKSPPPKGTGFGGIALTGGGNALMADLATKHGLRFPELSEQAQQEIRKLLPDWVTIANPLDTTDPILTVPGLLERLLSILFAESSLDMFAFVLPMRRSGGAASLQQLIPQVSSAGQRAGKPVAVISTISESLGEFWRPTILDSPMPFLQDLDRGLKAYSALAQYAERRRHILQARRAPDEEAFPTRPPDDARFDEAVLVGREAKALIAGFGVPVTRGQLTRSAEEAIEAAQRIGYPVVLKAASRQLLHVSDLGFVRLGLSADEAVRRNFEEIWQQFTSRSPGAHLDGILVEEMIPGGREVIVGLHRDPEFGPVVAFGLGGVFVEVLNDVSMRLAPIDERTAREMIAEIRGAPVLAGIRGSAPADVEAIVQSLVAVSRLAGELGDRLLSLDINPLIVLDAGQGARAVDCVICLAPAQSSD